MSKREDSDEECGAGLEVYNEISAAASNPNVSHPNGRKRRSVLHDFYSQHARTSASSRSFSDGNSQRARLHSFPTFFMSGSPADASVDDFPMAHSFLTPSRVTSLPVLDTLQVIDASVWCPSPAPGSGRFPDARIGINMRGPNRSSDVLPSLMMMQSQVSLRPEAAPSTPSDDAMAAEEKKNSFEEASEMCTAFDVASVDTLESFTFNPCGQGEMVEDAMSLSAAALSAADGYPNSCNATGSEDKSDAVEDDDDDYEDYDYESGDFEDDDGTSPTDDIWLRETSSGNDGASNELTQSSASAVDWSSVQSYTGDHGSCGLLPLEHNAVGFEQGCRGGPGKVKLVSCSPLHCDLSSCSLRNDALSLNNLPNPTVSAELNAVLGAEAEPPDTGQSATDDDVEWACCKICWNRPWKLVFIPCGHGSCRPCYARLHYKLCPFCRKPIRETVEVHIVCSLEA